MLEGIHLPLCYLAAVGLARLTALVSRPVPRRVFAATIVALTCISTLDFTLACLRSAVQNNLAPGLPPRYLATGDVTALQALSSLPDSPRAPLVVLCLDILGNYVPQATGHITFSGHWAETLDWDRKQRELADFYTGKLSIAQSREWLRAHHIGFVLEGHYERLAIGKAGVVSPGKRLGLRRIFEADGTTVYEVAG